MQNDPQYEAVRQRVLRRLLLRASFIFNLIFTTLITILLLGEWNRDPESHIGVAFFLLIWGSLLILHGTLAFGWFGGLIDRAARRELEREDQPEKPKRHQLELTEDGELLDVVEEDLEPAKRKNVV
ncbi:MAG: hypothetical protein K8L97_14520 [Anaerolineae bacterium]|nr:hypothetical protein [Anaerolineae bacterium]